MKNKLHQERLLANRRWRAKHPSRAKRSSYKSMAKTFLTKYATANELKQCQMLIKQLKNKDVELKFIKEDKRI